MSNHWTFENIPDQSGRVAIVTGANSGIGYETAKALAAKGAAVIMACRNRDKAFRASENIRHDLPQANLQIIHIDLADLGTVQDFSQAFKVRYDRLDLLINNAGVMMPPYTLTKDGFELQFGANHLGHFALTGQLLDIILGTPRARIVNVSSSMHRRGTIDFDNLNAEMSYSPQGAYSQSKLANLLFTLQLNKHLAGTGADAMAVSAHPGWTVTGLQRGFLQVVSRVIGQSPPMGALPTLRAAVDKDVQPDDYYGPEGFMEMRGYPVKVGSIPAAKDPACAQKLWQVSEQMTAVSYDWHTTIQPQ